GVAQAPVSVERPPSAQTRSRPGPTPVRQPDRDMERDLGANRTHNHRMHNHRTHHHRLHNGRARRGLRPRHRHDRPNDPGGALVTESSFDATHPPSRELLNECVHCGFCLPTCPTYQLWGEEMDSPRGRIYLMDLAERGEIGLEGAFTE